MLWLFIARQQKANTITVHNWYALRYTRGKTATFEVTEEAKVHSAVEARWQKSKNGDWYMYYAPYVTNLNITDRKYHGSVLFHSPKLVINDAELEDESYYRIQVRIREGWCNSGSVYFRVRGSKCNIYKCLNIPVHIFISLLIFLYFWQISRQQ